MKSDKVEVRAADFWRRAGHTEPFPRSLEATVSWALPLAIIKLPRLSLGKIHRWLVERQVEFECQSQDRDLRACLLARAGCGMVFVDGSDPADERRLSLAHEVAHFLFDYLEPRRRAVEALGQQILPVLDGDREPSIAERVDGALRGVAMGTFEHLMDRTASGNVTRMGSLESEDRADQLALELLAPRRIVVGRLEAGGIAWQQPSAFVTAETLLVTEFGLPESAAKGYGRSLVLSCRGPRSFNDWLKK